MSEESAKNNIFINPSLMQQDILLQIELENNEKIRAFKERIIPFENISSLKEAKALATKLIPTANETNTFYIGNAKCVVINRTNLLRISLDTTKEFICYDFSQQKLSEDITKGDLINDIY